MAKRKSQMVSNEKALEALTNLVRTGTALEEKFPQTIPKEELESPEYAAYYDAWQVAESIASIHRIENG